VSINNESVGRLFVPADWNGVNRECVWQCVAFTDKPTATLENIVTGERRCGTVGSSLLKGFMELQKPEANP